MIKYSGKVYEAVIELLKERGIDTEGVGVRCTRGNGYHSIIKNECIIGDYNYKSKEIKIHE